MKKANKIKTVTHMGVRMKLKIKYVESIDGVTGKILFPQKLKEANEMLGKVKNLDEILNKKPF